MIERVSQTESIIVQILHESIAGEFLDVQHYKQTQENNNKGSFFHQVICYELENYYKLILDIPSKSHLLLQKNGQHDRWELQKFKDFLLQLFQIFNLVSEFQIEGFSTMRTSSHLLRDNEFSFNQFTRNIQKYATMQQNFSEKKKEYQVLIQKIATKEKEFKEKTSKPYHLFNIKYINSELSAFKSQISEKQRLEEQIESLYNKISENTGEFQRNLMFLKQRFIMKKYQQIDKISKLVKNSQQSLIEMLTFMFQYIKSHKNLFRINKTSHDFSNKFKNDLNKEQLSQLIISETNKYRHVLDQYIKIMNQLINSFSRLSDKAKEWKGKQKQLLDNLNGYYQFNQYDVNQIKDLLNLYNTFFRYLSQLGDSLVFSVNNMIQLKNKAQKCSEMTLTLTKCMHISSPSDKSQSPRNQMRKKLLIPEDDKDEKKYLDILDEEMSPVYIQGILTKVYGDFSDAVTKIRDSFLTSQPHKRKNLEDSMSISHISERNVPADRRPFKAEFWLWKNWRQELSKDYEELSETKILLQQLDQYSQQFKKDDKDVQTLECLFQSKNKKGVMHLRQKNMLFDSNDNSLSIFVPFSEIQSVDMQMKMISKTLTVETTAGNLPFVDLTEGGVKKFYVAVQKTIDSFRQNNQEKPVVSNKVTLNEEQVQFIQNRRKMIEKDLEKTEDYLHIVSITLEDMDIIDVYRVVYSGQPVNINGKEYQNYQTSLAKRLDDYNLLFTDISPPGPQFYSGQPGTTFRNCSLVSTKSYQNDHKIPKVPFMPDHCHVKHKIDIYWVDHEEINVREEHKSYQVPFTQNFYTVGLHIIRQVGKDVEMKFYYKIVEVSDFSLKSVFFAKTDEQFRKGTKIWAQHVKVAMFRFRRRGDGSSHQEQPQNQQNISINSDRTIIKEYKSKIKKLQNKNTCLIVVIVVVFVLNVIILYYF